MPKIKVAAVHMLPGDVLTGSKELVLSVSVGISTPKGKVDVELQNPHNGRMRVGHWGRHTMIGVERKGEP